VPVSATDKLVIVDAGAVELGLDGETAGGVEGGAERGPERGIAVAVFPAVLREQVDEFGDGAKRGAVHALESFGEERPGVGCAAGLAHDDQFAVPVGQRRALGQRGEGGFDSGEKGFAGGGHRSGEAAVLEN
jgi:hypothetical protein